MGKDFIWIDESYDQTCIHGKKFYVLCAIKITATPSQIHRVYTSKGHEKGEIHSHVLSSYEKTKGIIRKINNGKAKPKRKLRITELHESVLLSNKKTRRIKTLFLKELFQSDPDINLEIYYVYKNFKENLIINNKNLYQYMSKELLNLFPIQEGSNIIMDICLDCFSSSKEHEDIIRFLREECSLHSTDIVKFDESQANFGLQAVDNVVGTIRRSLHQQAEDKENYEIIKSFIVKGVDIGFKFNYGS